MKMKNRKQTGEMLSKLLHNYENSDALVLAIPRGGVIVGSQIAKLLNLSLELIITKKISHPQDENVVIGAIAQDGNPVFISRDTSQIEMKWLNEQVRNSREEIAHRHELYHKNNQPLNIEDKEILLVTDGILSGLSVMAAIEECQRLRARSIVVVTPSISIDAALAIQPMVKKLVSLTVEETLKETVDEYYEDEQEITDETVIAVLEEFAGAKQ